MKTITISVLWVPPKEVRGNSRAHWRTKHKKNQLLKLSGLEQALISGETFQKARITYTWFKAGVGDVNNFAIGMKGFEDGLVEGNMFKDDDSKYLVQGEHGFQKVKRGEEKTVIVIEELETP